MNKYWGHDGGHLERNVGDVYTNNFDWICCKDKIIKHKPTEPKTIYLKTDYMKKWYKDIVKEQDYILICGASDDSAQQHGLFNQLVKRAKWCHIENKIHTQNKVSALTVGLATHSIEQENLLDSIRFRTKKLPKMDRVFCRWRIRSGQREKALEWAINQSHCDVVFDEMPVEEFYETLAGYKYTLCPVGYGHDPAPKIWECLLMGSVPIVLKTHGTKECYGNMPVLLVDKWDDVTTQKLDMDGDKASKRLQKLSVHNYISIENQIRRINNYNRCS